MAMKGCFAFPKASTLLKPDPQIEHLLEGSYLSAEMHSVFLQPQPIGQRKEGKVLKKNIMKKFSGKNKSLNVSWMSEKEIKKERWKNSWEWIVRKGDYKKYKIFKKRKKENMKFSQKQKIRKNFKGKERLKKKN